MTARRWCRQWDLTLKICAHAYIKEWTALRRENKKNDMVRVCVGRKKWWLSEERLDGKAAGKRRDLHTFTQSRSLSFWRTNNVIAELTHRLQTHKQTHTHTHTQVSCSLIKQYYNTGFYIKDYRQLPCRKCGSHVYVCECIWTCVCVRVCVWGYTRLCCWVTVLMTEQWDKSQKPLYHLFIASWLWYLLLLKAAWSQPNLTLSSLTSTEKYRDEVQLWRTVAKAAINHQTMQQISLWIAQKSFCICFASQSCSKWKRAWKLDDWRQRTMTQEASDYKKNNPGTAFICIQGRHNARVYVSTDSL